MKIIVTGSEGLLGKEIVKHLEKRDSLLGWLIISKESYQYSKFKIRYHNR